MDKTTLQEIAALWEKTNEIERKLSVFTERRHEENAERITSSEEALCDVDEVYDQRMAEVEEALCEISELL